MNKFGVGQDEFIFRMYSIALIAITGAAAVKGDLRDGIMFLMQPGTYAEQEANVPLDERVWSPIGKLVVMVLFSSMGFFGSSCSAAITKNFGALSMSITSTARKATTLFLSFLLFDNVVTVEHIIGIVIFISALTAKSVRRKNKRRSYMPKGGKDVEMGRVIAPDVSQVISASFDSLERTSPNARRRDRRANRRADNSNSASPRIRYHVV